MDRYFRGKRVMVTGVCGTVGREIARKLLAESELRSLIGIDHNESELVFLEEASASLGRAEFFLCDVRDGEALSRLMHKVDIVFHTAAYKHVYVSERSPLEAIKTNILGLHNVLRAARDNGIERLVFTSSDKAVNPTNVMGTSKLMGERLVTAAASQPDHDGAIFLSTRFGNVLGSRGSVLPIFRQQIRAGGPVTLTDPGMTRFIMSLDEAVRLVIESAVLGRSGDVVITKMPAVRIVDLAEVLIRECAPRHGYRPQDIGIKVVGAKPGEKILEELMNEEEVRRSYELERYFVVRPAIERRAADDARQYAGLVADRLSMPYNSGNATPLDQEQLASFLRTNHLLD